MKICKVKKTGATIGLTFAVLLITFALGVAQDNPPFGLSPTAGLHRSVSDDSSCVGDHVFQAGLAPKPASSIFWARSWPQTTLLSSVSAVNSRFTRAVIQTRKVSLYLLDAILLI